MRLIGGITTIKKERDATPFISFFQPDLRELHGYATAAAVSAASGTGSGTGSVLCVIAPIFCR